jgi:hypothetical protein
VTSQRAGGAEYGAGDRGAGERGAATVVLAELELFHSRPIAPTRRVALGRLHLPVEPPPGAGGLLLAAVVAAFLQRVDEDFHDDYMSLLTRLERGERIPQPQLRHRLQRDHVGLTRSRHRLLRREGRLRFAIQEDRGAPEQHCLAAAYAAGQLPYTARPPVMDALRLAVGWTGPLDAGFVAFLDGAHAALGPGSGDPLAWALRVLEFDITTARPDRKVVVERFRHLLRTAHPDTGGTSDAAAQRILDLTEARRILLAG